MLGPVKQGHLESMMSATSKPQAQYLKDYQAPHFSIQHIDLRFELAPLKPCGRNGG